MIRQQLVHESRPTQHTGCDPRTRVTRSLLGYGMIVGPFYLVTVLAQALTRDGFELTRHPASLLAVGPWGWIQVVDFLVSGLMVIAFATGLRRAMPVGRGLPVTRGRPAAGLLAGYGASLIAAGVFRADPAAGFPVGTPTSGPVSVSWHGLLHLIAGGIGFSLLGLACFVLARAFAAEGRGGWAVWSRLTGAALLAGFVMIAASGGSRAGTVTFTAAVVAGWAWIAAVAADRYRRLAR